MEVILHRFPTDIKSTEYKHVDDDIVLVQDLTDPENWYINDNHIAIKKCVSFFATDISPHYYPTTASQNLKDCVLKQFPYEEKLFSINGNNYVKKCIILEDFIIINDHSNHSLQNWRKMTNSQKKENSNRKKERHNHWALISTSEMTKDEFENRVKILLQDFANCNIQAGGLYYTLYENFDEDPNKFWISETTKFLMADDAFDPMIKWHLATAMNALNDLTLKEVLDNPFYAKCIFVALRYCIQETTTYDLNQQVLPILDLLLLKYEMDIDDELIPPKAEILDEITKDFKDVINYKRCAIYKKVYLDNSFIETVDLFTRPFMEQVQSGNYRYIFRYDDKKGTDDQIRKKLIKEYPDIISVGFCEGSTQTRVLKIDDELSNYRKDLPDKTSRIDIYEVIRQKCRKFIKESVWVPSDIKNESIEYMHDLSYVLPDIDKISTLYLFLFDDGACEFGIKLN